MSKPTEKQISAAVYVQQQARWWQVTNDIHSPTHYCEIESEVLDMAEHLTESEIKQLTCLLSEIYTLIKRLE